MKKKYLIFGGLISAGILAGLLISLISAEIIMKTSGMEFCGSCHSMQPMAKTFSKDIHGGNNSAGIVADCSTCHLPNSSVVSYIFAKAAHGVKDVFAETFTDTSQIDWEARRKEGGMVYDEGCMSCHRAIMDENPDRSMLTKMHNMYEMSQETENPMTCLSCHTQVGHKRG